IERTLNALGIRGIPAMNGRQAWEELQKIASYAEASGRDPLSIPGSIYGAIGICQFMPSNLQRYGVDATGKGYVDPFSQKDAFPSVANYLREKGWSSRMGRRDKHRLLLTYNRDHRYANTVLAVADRLKGGEGMRKKKGAVASL
ncbi:MAG: lytic murein transglycosylase, partial [Syntrophales bacterium]|nr:lytic murein transglycosylase [Syntrophales bacterium]